MNILKNVMMALAMALVAVVGLWFKNRQQEAMVSEAAGQRSTGQITAERSKFYAVLARATSDWTAGHYYAAALALYDSFPAYEGFLQEQGHLAVAPGKTYRDEFEAARLAFVGQVMEHYPDLTAQVKAGDLAFEEMENVANHLPFPFAQELRRTWSRDRRAVEEARRASARNWFIVFVSGPGGRDIRHAGAIRDALRKKWRDHPRLKLVFDKPAGAEREAARYWQVNFSETNVVYEFAKNQRQHGSGEVPEVLTVKFQVTVPRGKLQTNWDKLPPVTVKYSAPEKLSFKFKNARQTADFEGVLAEQRAKLTDLLVAELEKSIPPIEITPAM